MAVTAFGALTAAQKKVWATKVSVAGRDQNFWMSNGFMGRDTNDMSRPIHRITELTKTERGLICVMQLVAELEQDGVVGDNVLEGNEEALVNDAIELRVDQLRHGVKSRGRVAEQETVIRFRNVGRDKLSFWLGDTIDEMMFLVAAGRAFSLKTNGATRTNSQLPQISYAADITAASSGRVMHAGSATSEATLTASDTMNWNLIVKACAYAKRKKIKPIKGGGRNYYAIVMSTEQTRDLKQDNTYQTLVAKAHNRGPDNPLFKNALAVVDGVILYEHNKCYNTIGAASGSKWGAANTVDGAQAMLLGSQALGYAQIGDADWNESDNTDYNNRPGIAYGRMIGMKKPVWKSQEDNNTRQDFGILSIKAAAAETT